MFASLSVLSILANLLLLSWQGAAEIVQLPLSSPGQAGFPGVLDGAGKTVCYNFSLTASQVREVVWWTTGRVAFYLEPCAGKPHMKISIYGCPSQGAYAVWDYMSPAMASDLQTQGKTVPPAWQWVGDVESLVLELTHKTYFVEISHQTQPYPSFDGLQTYASYRLQAQILDLSWMPLEALNPLENLCGWDRTIYSIPRTSLQDRILGGLRVAVQVNETKSEIRWYPPGKGGVKVSNCPWDVNVSGNFSYQIYVKDITDFVGTSGLEYNIDKAHGIVNPSAYPPGAFADVLKPKLCPAVSSNGQGPCTSYDCRSCPTSYPRCPKQFLSNCTEVAASILKLKEDLNGTERPIDSYLKDPTNFTMWTVCGLYTTANRFGRNRMVETRPLMQDGGWLALKNSFNTSGPDGVWWTSKELNADPVTGMLSFDMLGLSEDRNNVYMINIVVRDEGTNQTAAYHLITIQMETATYAPPKLTDTAKNVLIGLTTCIGVLIILFASLAVFAHRKRVDKRSVRKRQKK